MTEDPVDPHRQRTTVRDGYEGAADAYRSDREAGTPSEAPLVERFLGELSPGERLLDGGCGQGTPVLTRVPEGVEAVGVDLATAQLRLARGRTDAALVRGDLTRLPLAAGSVDAVTALHSVIHVPLSEHPRVYEEFARVLRPGGRLYLTAADGEGWDGYNPDWLASGAGMAWSFPALAETREQLRAAGFRVTDERVVADTVSDEDDEADAGAFTHLFATLAE